MLFGTDGIRGEICLSPNSYQEAVELLLQERKLCNKLMHLVGLGLGEISGDGSTVIIGWDDRPSNTEIVRSLTSGLQSKGCYVIHAGMCATPGLQNALLETKSDFGCMITASHNPVSDSGIKIFDSQGYKTYPEFENDFSNLIYEISNNESENTGIIYDTKTVSPNSTFDANSAHQELLLKRFKEFSDMFALPKSANIIIDSSKGIAHQWISPFLENLGINATEVSLDANALNENCGAGELKPTDSWKWEEIENESHLLIRSLQRTEPGKIIAAALDGDGDRCLIIESTSDGCRVVDGDEMADHILRSAKGNWHLAASIESDLSLISSLDRLHCDVSFTQTAVGDRWLANALRDSKCQVIGVEDSGHIVLSSPAPNGGRTLVGDGIASLLMVLCAMSCENRSTKLSKGFKKRVSISPSNRSKWTGDNDLADAVEKIANQSIKGLRRSSLEGESNLMLLEKSGLSIGIRNSGTQAKTNVSLRVSSGLETTVAENVANAIFEMLRDKISN